MTGTKTNFNVLKLRACAKPARLHCKQAREFSVDIWIPDWVPTDVLKKIWTIHRWYVRSTNVTTGITLRFTVTSVTSSPWLWSTSILMKLQFTRRHTTMSSKDLFKHSICLQCSTEDLTLPQSIFWRWLLSNSMSQTRQSLYHFCGFFWETFLLSITV